VSVVAAPPRCTGLTALEALQLHGLSWERLEKIAGKALHDAMRARNISLDEDRRDRAHWYFIELGLSWSLRYDPQLAGGMSFATSCYRHLYGDKVPGAKLIDFLRKTHGDERRGTPLHVTPAGDRYEFADAAAEDTPDLDEAFQRLVDDVQQQLSPRALAILRTIGRDVVVLGLERWRIAETRGIPAGAITDLLEEVGRELGYGLEAAA
jgi:hypothetical protein